MAIDINCDITWSLQPNVEHNVLDFVDHSCDLQVNFSSNQDMGMSVKVSSLFQCDTKLMCFVSG